jgi:hypothetical protein
MNLKSSCFLGPKVHKKKKKGKVFYATHALENNDKDTFANAETVGYPSETIGSLRSHHEAPTH